MSRPESNGTPTGSGAVASGYAICVSCGSRYAAGTTVCPVDSSQLVAVSANSDEHSGLIIAERYQLSHCIGEGAWAVVYEALDLTLERRLAVKIMRQRPHVSAAQLERFQREATLLCKIEHANVCRVYDSGIMPDERPFLVVELVDGAPLSEIVERSNGNIDISRAAQFISQVSDGLIAVHKAGLLHRDIKPSNILIGVNGAKIVDFGMAKAVGHEEFATLTNTGEMLGTPKYMSPEQCAGRELHEASEVYSLACVAFELISGRSAISAKTPHEYLHAHMHQKAPLLISVCPEKPCEQISAVLAKALSKKPGQRYSTVSEFKSAFETAVLADKHNKRGPLWSLHKQLRLAFRPGAPWRIAAAATAVLAFFAVTAASYRAWQDYQLKHNVEVYNRKFDSALALLRANDIKGSTDASEELLNFVRSNFGLHSKQMTSACLYAADQALLARNLDKAKRFTAEAMENMQGQGPLSPRQAKAFEHAAAMMFQCHAYEMSARYLSKAVQLQQDDPHRSWENVIADMGQLGLSQHLAHQLHQSQLTLQKAGDLAQQHLPYGDETRVKMLLYLANNYSSFNDRENCLKTLNKAVEEATSASDRVRIAVYSQASEMYASLGKPDRVLPCLYKLVPLQETYHDLSALSAGRAVTVIGATLAALRKDGEADKAFKNAIAYVHRHKVSEEDTANAYQTYAEFLKITKRPKEAEALMSTFQREAQ